MKKAIYLLIAMVMLLGMLPLPALADDIVMYVSNKGLKNKG